MTHDEFLKGWLILITQPWGRQYRQEQLYGDLQLEFYFSQFSSLSAFQWSRVVTQFAGGNDWPSVDEMQKFIRLQWPVPAISKTDFVAEGEAIRPGQLWYVHECPCRTAMIRERVGQYTEKCKWCIQKDIEAQSKENHQ